MDYQTPTAGLGSVCSLAIVGIDTSAHPAEVAAISGPG
jgi:hypothetical protein